MKKANAKPATNASAASDTAAPAAKKHAVCNIVLYAVSDAGRSPVASYDPKDDYLRAKVAHGVSEKMRESQARGVASPAFKLVSETREADEGGRVMAAEFVVLDPHTLEALGSFARLEDAFKTAPAEVVPASPEEVLSKELSQ